MMRVPGSASAEVLLRVGLCHDEVIRALIREIGLDEHEAEHAWTTALQNVDAAYPYQAAAISIG